MTYFRNYKNKPRGTGDGVFITLQSYKTINNMFFYKLKSVIYL